MSSFLSFKRPFLKSENKQYNTQDMMNDFTHKVTLNENDVTPVSKTHVEHSIQQVEGENIIQNQFQNVLIDNQMLVDMLQQRYEILEEENTELKIIIAESQKRYEKAVREMQFFKKKYDMLALEASKHPQFEANRPNVQSYDRNSNPDNSPAYYNSGYLANAGNWPSSPTPTASSFADSNSLAPTARRRNNSNVTASTYSGMSANTEATNSMQSYQFVRNPSMVSSRSTPSSIAPSVISSGASSIMSVPPVMSVRSSTSSAYNSSSSNSNTADLIIQQRKIDPLIFGGSDALWDTLSKNEGGDATIEKLISNFLRRGGSPNTARQSESSHAVKYGYGMVHALVATKIPGALDLLLQQGANANVVSISDIDEEKVSPCYLAAQVGWLSGLQKLVQAGGDLMSARGCGSKKKTALHTAVEHGHAAVAEYVVNITQGVLNLETDGLGANPLHYACISGHADLVLFVVNVCQVPVNDKNHRGETPLHWAVHRERFDVVKLLIEKFGADVNAYVTRKVPTPYDMAKSLGYKKLAEYIKSVGGLSVKKMDKKKEEGDDPVTVPKHLESALSKNGFFMDGF